MSEQDTRKVIDDTVIASLLELEGPDDPGLVAELVSEFLVDAPNRIDELVRSLAAGDHERLGQAAHTLKSSSAYMGALGLSDLCRQIEEAARGSESDGLEDRVQRTQREFQRVREALQQIVA